MSGHRETSTHPFSRGYINVLHDSASDESKRLRVLSIQKKENRTTLSIYRSPVFGLTGLRKREVALAPLSLGLEIYGHQHFDTPNYNYK